MEIKGAFIFLTGAGIGAGISFLVTKKVYETKCAEEIEVMRKKYKAEGDSVSSAISEMKDIVKERYLKESESEDDAIIFTREESLDEESDIEEEMAESEFPEEEPEIRKYPYPITPEEYFEGDDPGIGKRALIYYAGDDTLVDETTEELQELGQIGVDNLGLFGKYEDKRLFIRNEPLGEDYEVIFEEGSFHQLDEEG